MRKAIFIQLMICWAKFDPGQSIRYQKVFANISVVERKKNGRDEGTKPN